MNIVEGGKVSELLRDIPIPNMFHARQTFPRDVIRPEDIPAILENGDRCLAGPTAPAQGLYMTGVWYDGEAGNMMLK